jgi:hypothetical protein
MNATSIIHLQIWLQLEVKHIFCIVGYFEGTLLSWEEHWLQPCSLA